MRQGLRLRRHQPQPGPVGRALDLAAAVGPAVVSDLREDGGTRHPRHDPRFHQLQRLLSHHGRALSERRHHGFHAMPDLGSVQGFPDPEIPDPAWRRRGALSLGEVPRPGAGAEEAAAEGALVEEYLLRHLRLSPARHRPLTKVIPVDNILFASEMIGAVKGIDPETGFPYDDTKRYIEASTILGAQDKHRVYEGNARRVFPRLDAALKAKGK